MSLTNEITQSLIWIVKNFFSVMVIFSLFLALITRFTQWGKQFWILGKDYFSLKNSVKPLAYFWIIIFFELLTVRINVLVTEWYKAMYDSLQSVNASAFWQQMIIFAVLAAINVANFLLTYYISESFQIHWRRWMNNKMLQKWTHNQAYYKVQYGPDQLDNPDQRIAQDITNYISKSLGFATGIISSTVSLVAFTIMLWDLSGPMQILGFEIPHAMVFLVFIYVLISSVLAFKIGRPLIKLNFASEWVNANYRYALIRVKEYAESIAFYRGEKAETTQLKHHFDKVIDNLWQIIYRSLKLFGFNVSISQLSVIFPFIIQAGRYFAGQIKLGDLIQTAQAFGRVQSSLSFYRNSYSSFTSYRAILNRLTGFEKAIEHSQKEPMSTIHGTDHNVCLENLTINTPTDQPLIKNINLSLKAGDSLLIQGQSGIGKTTLLRSLAGLWPYAKGNIYRPLESSLFLSQKPYLPQGKLIDALYYPTQVPHEVDIKQATSLLEKVQLAHLANKLMETEDWTRVLSLGEQQRLSFARILLHKPKVVFLDEASASLDEGLEDAMYRLLKNSLPDTIIISVGHRSTLSVHHQIQFIIQGNGRWVLQKENA